MELTYKASFRKRSAGSRFCTEVQPADGILHVIVQDRTEKYNVNERFTVSEAESWRESIEMNSTERESRL